MAGAVGLLIPVLRGLAGLGLALFMIGAVATHVVHAEIGIIFLRVPFWLAARRSGGCVCQKPSLFFVAVLRAYNNAFLVGLAGSTPNEISANAA